jgi:phosphopantothenoylcysteine synthetase/decarboxylase
MFRPVIVAPAMNTHMWDHPVTASQLDTVRQWGYTVLEPQVRLTHRVHRVATAAFWRTFSDEGKISPGW